MIITLEQALMIVGAVGGAVFFMGRSIQKLDELKRSVRETLNDQSKRIARVEGALMAKSPRARSQEGDALEDSTEDDV